MITSPMTGAIIGYFHKYLNKEVSDECSLHLIPPSSMSFNTQAARVIIDNERKTVILSGSKMRVEYILKKTGTTITAASQAASITPRQYRLSFVTMMCHLCLRLLVTISQIYLACKIGIDDVF